MNAPIRCFYSIGFDEGQIDPHPTGLLRRAIVVGLIVGILVWVLAIWKMVDLFGLL